MMPFRERNPVTIGAAGLIVIALLMLAAFKAENLPLIGGGDVYYANFSEAGGLKANDEVRVAGVRVGKVENIELDGDKVRVAFRIDKGTDFGTETGASIRVKTLLGAMYIAIEPAGTGQLEPGSVIPVSRTSAPYDVVEAFSGLAETEAQINTPQLTQSLETLAALFENTPDEVRASLDGLSRLSQTVASRDAELNALLRNAESFTKVLADRNADLEALFKDGEVLLKALYARRAAVHRLLVSTTVFSQELTRLVNDTRADLKPALDDLEGVVDMLNKRQDQLDDSLRLMAPFYRLFANVLSNGPWFDTFIQNMPPIPRAGG
jgi:phospholipid/cholesterol/gamma-HCH transport system substrate-binding protein